VWPPGALLQAILIKTGGMGCRTTKEAVGIFEAALQRSQWSWAGSLVAEPDVVVDPRADPEAEEWKSLPMIAGAQHLCCLARGCI
jgi:hypothetical protein